MLPRGKATGKRPATIQYTGRWEKTKSCRKLSVPTIRAEISGATSNKMTILKCYISCSYFSSLSVQLFFIHHPVLANYKI